MGKKEITSKNLQRLAEEAGLALKALQKLYIADTGSRSASMVYQHWNGYRATSWDSEEKYIQIFKQFGIHVTHEDFVRN